LYGKDIRDKNAKLPNENNFLSLRGSNSRNLEYTSIFYAYQEKSPASSRLRKNSVKT